MGLFNRRKSVKSTEEQIRTGKPYTFEKAMKYAMEDGVSFVEVNGKYYLIDEKNALQEARNRRNKFLNNIQCKEYEQNTNKVSKNYNNYQIAKKYQERYGNDELTI